MSRAELKANAKRNLQGRYGEAVKLFVLFLFISYIASFVIVLLSYSGMSENVYGLLSNIVSFAIPGLFFLGYYSFFLKVSRNEEATYKELFSKTNLFLPCIAILLLVGIFTFLWSLLFIIPGIIAALSYSMVYFVALDNPELGAMDVIRKSKDLMQGHKMDYFILELSFVGWAILSVFTLGFLLLWLIPYMQVTMANFYNEIKKEA